MKKLDSRVLRFIGTIYRATNSKADFKYKQFDLQKGQYMFLTRICENPGINFVELSNMLKVDKATTTKAVQKLIDIGCLNKDHGEKDKREYKLRPTKKGLEVYEFILEEERKQLEITFNGFSEEEKKSVTELIRRMSENIEEYWIK